jgi:hypothetical protein
VFKPPGDPPTDRHHAEGDARQEQQEKLFGGFNLLIRNPPTKMVSGSWTYVAF